MISSALTFYPLALFLIFFSYMTVTSSNPIYSALYLAITMIGLAGMFFTLNAQFIAGVQLVVYAGAVMVLFVMVIMLFDLKTEVRAFTRGQISGFLKIVSSAMLAGLIIGAVSIPTGLTHKIGIGPETAEQTRQTTRELAILLFTEYLYAFEVLGLLLLVVAVGAVSISRVKGGTHAQR